MLNLLGHVVSFDSGTSIQVVTFCCQIKRPIIKVAIRIITKVGKSCVAAFAGSFLDLQSGESDHETHFDCWGWTGWNDHGL